METENILSININEQGQLCIKPTIKQFELIWRSATQVHWNTAESYLYSPKPIEWSYIDWYKHIVSVMKDEYGYKLIVTQETKWCNITEEIKSQIVIFNSAFL